MSCRRSGSLKLAAARCLGWLRGAELRGADVPSCARPERRQPSGDGFGEPAACDLDGDGFILGDKEEACSTTSDLSLTDDYVVNADTSEYNCNEKPDGKYEAAWCASSEPTGEERKLTKETLAKLKQRGGECAAIAQRGYELLQRGMIRYYPDNVIYGVNKNRDNFGGFAIPGIVALLGEAAVTYLGEMGKT